MDHNPRIASAITDLESQDRPNFSTAAREWKVDHTTLAKRFRGEISTIKDAKSYTR